MQLPTRHSCSIKKAAIYAVENGLSVLLNLSRKIRIAPFYKGEGLASRRGHSTTVIIQ
ncbi:hypothetical protein [Serratia ureilytica]|uniref:hypothetical protein n=1 Tax=Serratia ureilytica TaxID=300181 RepID=UPI001D1937E7|nr:hypothetical protein [Serratia ureilytica]MCC4107056.1 hypothetical protein [Serratia ureilytica]